MAVSSPQRRLIRTELGHAVRRGDPASKIEEIRARLAEQRLLDQINVDVSNLSDEQRQRVADAVIHGGDAA